MEELFEKGQLREYKYERKLVPILHSGLALQLKKLDKETFPADFTLGRYGETSVVRTGGQLTFKWGASERKIRLDELERVIKHPEKLYTVNGENEVVALEIRDKHYYKLMLPEGSLYPTLEIDGIHMHRIKNTNPLKDTLAKVGALGKLRGKKVLDTCTGLGYTAIIANKRGASVITVEKDPNVLTLAEVNPWSHDLEKVKVILGDTYKIIRDFPDGFFDVIIHDPPRFSMAGELYSQEFYYELSRVLKRGGKLFHYTGMPHAKYRGKSTLKGIANRLSKAGFRVKYNERAQGFVGVKVF